MKKILRVLSGVAIGASLAMGTYALAAGDGSVMVREKVVVALASYLDKHPDSQVAHQLALWLVPSKQDVQSLGGTMLLPNQGGETRTQTVCYRDSAGARCNNVGWEELTQFPAATTTIANPVDRLAVNAGGVSSTINWQEFLTNQPLYIDQAEIEVQGPVSSTFYAQMGTSTAAGGQFNLTPATAPSGLIQRTQFVTSTSDVTFRPSYQNLVQATSTYSINATASNFGNFSGVKIVSSTFVVISLFDNVIGIGGTAMCTNSGIYGGVTGGCEQVTSTARGFTIRGRIRYHYEKDL